MKYNTAYTCLALVGLQTCLQLLEGDDKSTSILFAYGRIQSNSDMTTSTQVDHSTSTDQNRRYLQTSSSSSSSSDQTTGAKILEQFIEWLHQFRINNPDIPIDIGVGTTAPTATPSSRNPISSITDVPAPVVPATTTLSPTEVVLENHCTCDSCTDDVWNTLAGDITCGDRILYLLQEQTVLYPTEQDACVFISEIEFPNECSPCNPKKCDGRGEQSTTTTATSHCGCSSCTDDGVWFNGITDGNLSCAARIIWVQNNVVNGNEIDACRIVANEFPYICGPTCHPELCVQQTVADTIAPQTPTSSPSSTSKDVNIPSTTTPVQTTVPDVGATIPSSPPTVLPPVSTTVTTTPVSTSNLYCFPQESDRKRWTNVWGKHIVEVKESGDGVCGPGNNKFSRNTVSVSDDKNELTLQFKMDNGVWTGSEVRVLLPPSEMPIRYGTFKFSIKSVVVKGANGMIHTSNDLPPSLVLGLFTWDDTDDYSIRENFSHEVDIEISRWNNATAHDGQFLVQPPGSPQMYRFSTGIGNTRNPGGHIYEFTWLPGIVSWSTNAGGGHDHSYTTKQAVQSGISDHVQCLPATALEIRMNLWNYLDTQTPSEMSLIDIAEVVIDDFQYIAAAADVTGIVDGDVCTKDCQCIPTTSFCSNQICIPRNP